MLLCVEFIKTFKTSANIEKIKPPKELNPLIYPNPPCSVFAKKGQTVLLQSQHWCLTRTSIYGLDLFASLQVPEANVGIQGAGCCDGTRVADVHRHHPQLVTLQSPLQIQLFIIPSVQEKENLP